PETCNNLDDDCDGLVDDGVTRACTGTCGAGAQVCIAGVFGSCVGRAPSTEVCDGIDNDCNGQVDDGLGTLACGIGACARTVPLCAGGRVNTCAPGAPSTEVCDGVDNDCNGAVDEGVTRACTTACGAGTQACVAGAFGPCASRT